MLVTAFKLILLSFAMFPVAFAALGVGVLFASFNLAVARNPEEYDNLFGNTMMAFALIETFVFTGLLIAVAGCFIIS